MKLTEVLCRQNIGWHLKQIWKIKSRRQVVLTRAEKVLKEKGVQIEDATEVISLKKKSNERCVHANSFCKNIFINNCDC